MIIFLVDLVAKCLFGWNVLLIIFISLCFFGITKIRPLINFVGDQLTSEQVKELEKIGMNCNKLFPTLVKRIMIAIFYFTVFTMI